MALATKAELITLLKCYSDVFAWTYDEIPGLDPSLVTHHLDNFSNSMPIKQHTRKYHPDLEAKIKAEAFDMVKKALISPLTMIASQPEKPLLLYLTSIPRSIGALLVQDMDGIKKPVYYISRKVNGVESRYTLIERHCLALIFIAQKLRHYFLAHPIQVMTWSDPVHYLLSKPTLTGKMEIWLLVLVEYEIASVTPKAIKSQTLVDLLAQFPYGEHESAKVPPPGEVHVSADAVETYWDLKFDGASGVGKGGVGITLTCQEGKKFHLSYKLDFECSNNEAEYEALILGLIATQKKGLRKLKIWGDS
ncbi:uncharacterized protein LOC114264207 [Camellia sinensis]|uniref:uncharacterized protein LOC114264207 n=1 Tax=Camellia sinensis TaxID=4442 RepID=UPI001035656F|nr:uncharacterized protein LOC114264207 [Camellia sinensis]